MKQPAARHPANKSLTEALRAAFASHHRGELADARRRYLAILETWPDQFEALHWLAALEAQQGHLQAARELFSRALRINPDSTQTHLNLANVLLELGQHAEALASYDRTLAADTDHAEARNNRGNALHALGRYTEALADYDRALAAAPDYADALLNRGNTLQDLGRHDEALASYERVLALAPDHADAWNYRGTALQHLKRREQALASYDQALRLEPDNTDALNHRGNVLHELKRHAEALSCYDRALALDPRYPQALNNRGNVLQDLGRYAEALASYEQALALDPRYAAAFNNRGNALFEMKRHDEAFASYEQALKIAPDYADALGNRGSARQRLGLHEEALADFEQALRLAPADIGLIPGNLLHSRMHCCDWRDWQEQSQRLCTDVRAGRCSTTPFVFIGVSDSPQDQLACARLWARERYPAAPSPLWKGERYRHDRIRVAYVSSDLRDHAIGQLTAELFERHDRSRFETIAISLSTEAPDEIQSRLKGAFGRFIDAGRNSDREIAQLLRDLETDIAVDLNGYTLGGRTGIFALRPAPLQVNYLGYPGTLGTDYFDYIVADRCTIPVRDRGCYAEQVVHLPDTYLVSDSTRRIAKDAPSRAAAGLPGQGFVFCAFNRSYKITPPVFEIWMRLLCKVEGSVLWLSESAAAASHNLRREAAQRGVAPERLIFAPRLRRNEDHLARQMLADLFLDTLPYNAHTTASDALWAGLPVVTCTGNTFAGRVAAGLLNAVGLPELVTHTLEEYEALTLRLACDAGLLAAIRGRLASNRASHPLFDTDRFRRHLEAAYTTMWERWQRGEAAAGFAVDPLPWPRPAADPTQ